MKRSRADKFFNAILAVVCIALISCASVVALFIVQLVGATATLIGLLAVSAVVGFLFLVRIVRVRKARKRNERYKPLLSPAVVDAILNFAAFAYVSSLIVTGFLLIMVLLWVSGIPPIFVVLIAVSTVVLVVFIFAHKGFRDGVPQRWWSRWARQRWVPQNLLNKWSTSDENKLLVRVAENPHSKGLTLFKAAETLVTYGYQDRWFVDETLSKIILHPNCAVDVLRLAVSRGSKQIVLLVQEHSLATEEVKVLAALRR